MVYYKLGGNDPHAGYRQKFFNYFTEDERDILVICGFTVDGMTACHKVHPHIEIQKRNNGSFVTAAFGESRFNDWGNMHNNLNSAIIEVNYAILNGELL